MKNVPTLCDILKINVILHGSEPILQNTRLDCYENCAKELGLIGAKVPCVQGELLSSITSWPGCLVYRGSQLRQGWAGNPDASH